MTVSSGTYRIRNVKSKTYLDESKKNPGTVHGWDSRPDNENQRWRVEQSGGGYVIRNAATNQYLSSSGTDNGSNVQASGNQTTWDIREKGGAYEIIAQGSNAAVDLDRGSHENGADVNLWNASGASQQQWTFEQVGGSSGHQQEQQQGGQYSGPLQPGAYFVRNVHAGTALDLSGASSDDGARVIGYQVTSGNNQKWVLERGTRGYRIKNNASGTYAGFGSSEQPADGVLLTGNRNQVEWVLKQVDQGYQVHLASNENLVLDLASGDASDGAKICLWTNKGENNQKWNFQSA